jgi:hypothetical protein
MFKNQGWKMPYDEIMHIPHIVKRFEAGLGEKLFQSLTF